MPKSTVRRRTRQSYNALIATLTRTGMEKLELLYQLRPSPTA
jgi:hypothetical protein